MPPVAVTPQQRTVLQAALFALAVSDASRTDAADAAYDAPDPASQIVHDAATWLRARLNAETQAITAIQNTLAAMGL